MRITFNRTDFLRLLNQRDSRLSQFGNGVISKFQEYDVYATWSYLYSSCRRGVYVRYQDYAVSECICFVNNDDWPDANPMERLDVLRDMLGRVTSTKEGEYFIVEECKTQSSHFSPILTFKGETNHMVTTEDWTQAVKSEGIIYASGLNVDSSRTWDQKLDRCLCSFDLHHSSVDRQGSPSHYKLVVGDLHGDSLFSGSCLLVVSSSKYWTYNQLKPFVHYIPFTSDGGDARATIDWCWANPVQVRQVADRLRLWTTQCTQMSLTRRLNDLFSHHDNQVACSSKRFEEFVRERVAPIHFRIPWVTYCERRSSHVSNIDIEWVSHCFFQAAVKIFYLQWHHGVLGRNFHVYCQKHDRSSMVINELYDHVFNESPFCIMIDLDPKNTYYIDTNGLTNYPFGMKGNNIIDLCRIFGEAYDLLRPMCTRVQSHASKNGWRSTYEFLFEKFYKADKYYTRHRPSPFLTLSSKSINTNLLPIQFDLNTNKLVIYRHYQIMKNVLSKYHERYYRECLKKVQPTLVEYSLWLEAETVTLDDWMQMLYKGVFFQLPDSNDTVYQRLVMELETVWSKTDRLIYQTMFKSLTSVDKVCYSINYALLKTLKTFTEQ